MKKHQAFFVWAPTFLLFLRIIIWTGERTDVDVKKLIKRCQRGDQQAFDDLIRLYYSYVSGFLLKACNDRYLCEDLTQETFLKMIQNIEKYDLKSKTAFGTWLIAIAKNCYIDWLRRNKTQMEDIDSFQFEDSVNIEQQVSQKMEYEQVMEALQSLPPEQAEAIRLKYLEDMTLAEIAERFNVQPKTIKSRIHDGTMKLRKKLHHTGKEE